MAQQEKSNKLPMYQAVRQCYSKASFTSKKIAKKRIGEILNEGGPHLYVYGCTQCGNFHLTRNSEVAEYI